MTNNTEQIKHVADAASVATVAAAWLGLFSTVLTILATGAALLWTCIRIYETRTVQKWLGKDDATFQDE